jgi:outer membrane protein assembly factor BamE (lipoprotein component of BamABCDE complex)
MVLAISLTITVSACGIARQMESGRARDQLVHLQVGMDRETVLSLMGKPYTREAYGSTEYLFYETNHWANEEHRRFTPIQLKDGKVVGWGQKYYIESSGQKSKTDARVKSP